MSHHYTPDEAAEAAAAAAVSETVGAIAPDVAAAAAALAEAMVRETDEEKAIREDGPGTTHGIIKLDPKVSESIDVSVGVSKAQVSQVVNELRYQTSIEEKQEIERKLQLEKANAKKLITDKKLAEYNARKKKLEAHKKMLLNIRNEKERKEKEKYLAELKIMEQQALQNYQNSVVNPYVPLASPGYHYMPDGTLMSDVEHAVLETLPKCSEDEQDPNIKKADIGIIQNFDFDYSDVSQDGETRNFIISASNGSVCSVEIRNSEDPAKYYNFYTNTFATAYSNLDKKVINGSFEFSVVFPSSISRKYDIFILAENGTTHAPYKEVLFDDNTVDLNSSTGSKSLLLHKELYQPLNKSLDYILSATTPNSVANLINPSATSNKTFSDSAKAEMGVKTYFEISYTGETSDGV